jgi:hypothetical protein
LFLELDETGRLAGIVNDPTFVAREMTARLQAENMVSAMPAAEAVIDLGMRGKVMGLSGTGMLWVENAGQTESLTPAHVAAIPPDALPSPEIRENILAHFLLTSCSEALQEVPPAWVSDKHADAFLERLGPAGSLAYVTTHSPLPGLLAKAVLKTALQAKPPYALLRAFLEENKIVRNKPLLDKVMRDAIKAHDTTLITLLIRAGFNPNRQSRYVYGDFPLLQAIRQDGSLPVVKTLIQLGARFGDHDAYARRALMDEAVRRRDPEILAMLLDVMDEKTRTALNNDASARIAGGNAGLITL